MDIKQFERIQETSRFILNKLYFAGYIGDSHTAIENLKKGLPSHLGHYVDKATKGLIKDNYIIKKPTGYGLHVSLNEDKMKEIKGIIGIKD